MKKNIALRIHGDNIIECERALQLVTMAYQAEVKRVSTCIYLPVYELFVKGEKRWEVELFAGHERWGVNIGKVLVENGAPLREATDAYLTKIILQDKEQIYLAIEFCNALPAGNNAWQRSGRAIASASVGIPYLYYAEIGGVELDGERGVKAPRFPNPIVPFAYLTATNSLQVICVPIYEAHPAISEELRAKFAPVFGLNDSLKLIKCLLEDNDTENDLQKLIEKGITLVEILSNERKRVDTFKGIEWRKFLGNSSGLEKVKWLAKNATDLIWQKKQSDKVQVSATFQKFIQQVQALDCLSVGAKEIPICLIPTNKLKSLAGILTVIYPKQKEIIRTFQDMKQPLVIVWITGFKPQGDDSRPDRGLVPLARMLFGKGVNILTVVYGPAKESTWKLFASEPDKLAEINGLWEAIINLSNYVFIDSATSKQGVLFYKTQEKSSSANQIITFPKAIPITTFSEHDVDTAIHTLFSNKLPKFIFEGMCNPPGGDWSGVSIINFKSQTEYRWTSLPRVSAVEGKRPDHVFQLLYRKEMLFLVIESKFHAKDLETNIGERLKSYLIELFQNPPTAQKEKDKNWELYLKTEIPLKSYKTYSGAAFIFRNEAELEIERKKGNLDFVLAFELKPIEEESTLHLQTHIQTKFLHILLTELCQEFGRGLKIKIY